MEIMQELGRAIVNEKSFTARAQSVCRILRRRLPHYSWVGIYMIRGDKLKLEAWDGPQATQHVEIPIGEGICGLAARTKETVAVDDVNKDPRYLQCFVQTKSEIVVPIMKGDTCLGEIDVDSDKPAAFNALDKQFLEWLADLLSQ
jgi:GAF domain-containing protein